MAYDMTRCIYVLYLSIIVTGLYAQNCIPVSVFQPSAPSSYEIDRTCDVGNIPYTQCITENGAVSVNIPLEIYQAPNNFSPSLSLNYNSSSSVNNGGYAGGIVSAALDGRRCAEAIAR